MCACFPSACSVYLRLAEKGLLSLGRIGSTTGSLRGGFLRRNVCHDTSRLFSFIVCLHRCRSCATVCMWNIASDAFHLDDSGVMLCPSLT